ncbi:MAG TPA: hypothetical protein VE981_19480 [Planctomycetota bacterium]|nr:hypothetical protein [Planctomycetota bacterium]
MTEPEVPPATRIPTVREEGITVLVVSLLMMACIGTESWQMLGRVAAGRPQSPPMFIFLAALIHAYGNATWITLDRKRRGREVGFWRFAALFLGPAALVVYILLEYRAMALFYPPILVAVDGATWYVPSLAVVLLRRAWL